MGKEKDNIYPRMLYKASDSSEAFKIDGETFLTLVVADKEAEAEAKKDKWTLKPTPAKK